MGLTLLSSQSLVVPSWILNMGVTWEGDDAKTKGMHEWWDMDMDVWRYNSNMSVMIFSYAAILKLVI